MQFSKVFSAAVVSFSLVFHFSVTGFAIPSEGRKVMISGPSPWAVQVGKNISKKGGNVVDIAVAIELALAVTSPYYASLGGGGFALVKLNSKIDALDFREKAPSAATPKMYEGKIANAAEDGVLAVATPGMLMGIWELHKKYGKLHWSQLFSDAIMLAEKGFEVSGEWVNHTKANKGRMNREGLRTFFKKDLSSYEAGENFKQPGLAKLLKEIRNRGPVPLYRELAADDIVQTVQAGGGILKKQDLKDYKVRWLQPIQVDFQGYKISMLPPPSSGGIVAAHALKLIEKKELWNQPAQSANELHLLGEILARSFRIRSFLGDPDFSKNAIPYALDEKLIQTEADSIRLNKKTSVEALSEKEFYKEETETTHFSVMDQQGNTVAMTITINGIYGSGVVTPKYGIVLNNEMDDFTARPNVPNQFGLVQGVANQIEPKKTPLSSMNPMIVEKGGETVLSLGAPGGPRIITATLQALYRVLVSKQDIDHAIQSPRIHHQFLPDLLYAETHKMSPELLKELKAKGHTIESTVNIGKVYGVSREPGQGLKAAFDSRGEGAAGGY